MDVVQVDLFLMLRALAYVGWTVPQMAEEGSRECNARFIATGIELTEAWLEHTRSVRVPVPPFTR
jgi:hypothetical protein